MRFNTTTKRTTTTNIAGGKAYTQDQRLELISILLTSFLQDKYYQSANKEMERITNLVKADPLFAAKAAIVARNEYGMRSVSHAVASDVMRFAKGMPWVKFFLYDVVRRPDDMLEIISCHLARYGKEKTGKGGKKISRPLPNSLKTAFRHALEEKFDEYQLSKYRGEGKGFSLVDLVNLVHPKARNGAIAKLMKGELMSSGTWETKLTQAGQNAENEDEKADLKNAAWSELIRTKKIGYFALLRNLRNILRDAPDCITETVDMLTDENLIRKSLVLPFRFTTALTEIRKVSGSREVIRGINKALEISLKNVPFFPGKTLIAVDTSGSMAGRPIEIASLFGAVLYKSNDSDLIRFSDDATYLTPNPDDSLHSIVGAIQNTRMGGTNFHSIFNLAARKYDRIIILSDMQAWINHGYSHSRPDKSLQQYRDKFDCNPHIYSIDLQGYGSMQFPEERVYALAGWSEKIFDVMKVMEEDRGALIRKIESVEIRHN